MLKRILVLGEGSTCAAQQSAIAARVARAFGGIVLLLRETEAPSRSGNLSGQQEAASATNMPLTPQAQPQKLPASEIATVPVSDAEALATFTEQTAARDLMLITVPETGCFERWMLERAAQRMARTPPVPVLIFRQARSCLEAIRPPRLLTATVALDGSRRAEAALLPAAHLIAALAAPATGCLHLTRVVLRPEIDALLQGQGWSDARQRDQTVSEAMDYLGQVADELQANYADKLGLTITWSVAMGSNVADTLVDIAEQGNVAGGTCTFSGCDLLALATHGHDVGGHWMPGSVTRHIFASTNLPVLLA